MAMNADSIDFYDLPITPDYSICLYNANPTARRTNAAFINTEFGKYWKKGFGGNGLMRVGGLSKIKDDFVISVDVPASEESLAGLNYALVQSNGESRYYFVGSKRTVNNGNCRVEMVLDEYHTWHSNGGEYATVFAERCTYNSTDTQNQYTMSAIGEYPFVEQPTYNDFQMNSGAFNSQPLSYVKSLPIINGGLLSTNTQTYNGIPTYEKFNTLLTDVTGTINDINSLIATGVDANAWTGTSFFHGFTHTVTYGIVPTACWTSRNADVFGTVGTWITTDFTSWGSVTDCWNLNFEPWKLLRMSNGKEAKIYKPSEFYGGTGVNDLQFTFLFKAVMYPKPYMAIYPNMYLGMQASESDGLVWSDFPWTKQGKG